MLARMRQLGGNLQIKSDASGTLVSARIPLTEAAPAAGSEKQIRVSKPDQRIKSNQRSDGAAL
jgi:hypothetical protein